MKNNHGIDTYSKLFEAAIFFLNESFHYINESMDYELASLLFSEELDLIDLTEEDNAISKEFVFSTSNCPLETLRSEDMEVLSDETIQKLSNAWIKSQNLSKKTKYPFKLKHQIKSIHILGYFNNYGFFVETIINRHLLFLRHANQIDDLSYTRISKARIMERMVFIFKNELCSGRIHLNEMVNLFNLRNKTVHYTPDNAIALNPEISEISQIWIQTKKILKELEKREKFNEDKFSIILEEKVDEFKNKWLI